MADPTIQFLIELRNVSTSDESVGDLFPLQRRSEASRLSTVRVRFPKSAGILEIELSREGEGGGFFVWHPPRKIYVRQVNMEKSSSNRWHFCDRQKRGQFISTEDWERKLPANP